MTDAVQLDLLHVRHVSDGLRFAASVRALRTAPGCVFAKVLGTGSAATFTPRDADLHRWATLTVWDDAPTLDGIDAYARVRGRAIEHGRLVLRPTRSRGTWSRRTPFAVDDTADPGPIAVLTRARIRPTQWWRFWSSIPPVATDATTSPGLLLALAVGEAPIGLQGTFSIWADEESLRDFAHRRAAHREVIRATTRTGWYAEELFARFAVSSASGSWLGRPLPSLLAGR